MTRVMQRMKGHQNSRDSENSSGGPASLMVELQEHAVEESHCEACSHMALSTVARPHYNAAVHWSWQSNINPQQWTPDLYDTVSRSICVTRKANYEKLM